MSRTTWKDHDSLHSSSDLEKNGLTSCLWQLDKPLVHACICTCTCICTKCLGSKKTLRSFTGGSQNLSESPLPARTKGGRAAKRGVTGMLCV